MTDSGLIPEPFWRIPVIPADSGAILAELPDSGWNYQILDGICGAL